jgi:predicted DNA-binding transcriptional regulator AlpA
MKIAKKTKAAPTPRVERTEPSVSLAALTMDQIAVALGCSVPTVYRLANEDLIKTFTIGRRRYASPRAVAECVALLEAKGSVLPIDTGANNKPTSVQAAAT